MLSSRERLSIQTNKLEGTQPNQDENHHNLKPQPISSTKKMNKTHPLRMGNINNLSKMIGLFKIILITSSHRYQNLQEDKITITMVVRFIKIIVNQPKVQFIILRQCHLPEIQPDWTIKMYFLPKVSTIWIEHPNHTSMVLTLMLRFN